jgi:hypothetical protein
VWQREYFDHLIRGEAAFETIVRYNRRKSAQSKAQELALGKSRT